MKTQEELDAIETEAYAQLKREEAIENGTRHDVHEPTTYELAEAELESQAKQAVLTHQTIMEAMMGKDYDRYFPTV
jgi:hypothetical protein